MRLLKSAIFFLVFLTPLHSSQEFSALLTAKNGPILKKSLSSSYSLKVGDFIYKGDSILLSKGIQATILTKRGLHIVVHGPYQGKIDNIKWDKSTKFSSDAQSFLKHDLKFYDMDVLRSMESFQKEYPNRFPYNSYLMSSPAAFLWKKTKHIRSCKINIYKENLISKNRILIKSIHSPNTGRLTNPISYKKEQPYSWELLLLIGRSWKNKGKRTFLIINNRTKNRIKEKLSVYNTMKKIKPGDITPFIIGTIVLIKEKLYHKALKEINTIISKHPLTAFPLMLRGRIYEEMNIKHLAARDYKNAKKLERR